MQMEVKKEKPEQQYCCQTKETFKKRLQQALHYDKGINSTRGYNNYKYVMPNTGVFKYIK